MDGSAKYVLAHTAIHAKVHAGLMLLLRIVSRSADAGIARLEKVRYNPDRAIKILA
jgi:hypothetical protein